MCFLLNTLVEAKSTSSPKLIEFETENKILHFLTQRIGSSKGPRDENDVDVDAGTSRVKIK